MSQETKTIQSIDEALKMILKRISEMDERLTRLEKESTRNEPKNTSYSLRSQKGQTIVPNRYKELNLNMEYDNNIAEGEMDVRAALTEAMLDVLRVVNKKSQNGKYVTTDDVVAILKLKRPTVSGRLNLLTNFGLIKKKRGKKASFTITQKALQYLD